MSEILSFLDIIKDIIISFPLFVAELIYRIFKSLFMAFEFITLILAKIPELIDLGLFDKLPSFFSYGVYSLLGIMLVVTVFKLFQMVKFW